MARSRHFFPLLIVAVGLIAGAALGVVIVKSDFVKPAQVINQNSLRQSVCPPTPSVSVELKVSKPARLEIPKLGINAAVEDVGLDGKDRMDIPKKPTSVAWYEYGVAPGEVGNAVMAGHYDWYDGPAVFYKLKDLAPGDEIIVTDQESKKHAFRVVQQATYTANQFPLDEVFGSSNSPHLNLITCGGVFNRSSKSYSHRIVVYAEANQSWSNTVDKSNE